MRKITQLAEAAFMCDKPLKTSNTAVYVEESETILFLFGNKIATKQRKNNSITFSMCGWGSPTTRERLEAAQVRIAQRKGRQFYIKPNREEIEIDPSATYRILSDGSISLESAL